MSGLASVSNKAIALSGFVPMIHVADVEGSIEFYKKLGFEVGNSVPPAGPKHWAWLYCPTVEDWKNGANLMVTRTARPLNADAQDVLFYLYASDLVALRDDLIAKAIKVSEISYPEYLPKGEFRIDDPDGYCVMVAQAGPNTP
jgi:glyoxalase/bleomycin resistance protein/dioxygenase superfamily protein